jgi:hypothetical protein
LDELSERSHVDTLTIRAVEQGCVGLDTRTVVKLATALGIQPKRLWEAARSDWMDVDRVEVR